MKTIIALFASIAVMVVSACDRAEDNGTAAVRTGDTMYISVNDNKLKVELENNSSALALAQLLEKGDITVDMTDYGGFEKVGQLPRALPRNDESMTTSPGDVILYQGDKITIYYGENTWSFTKLGRIDGVSADELKGILGSGDVTVTLYANDDQRQNSLDIPQKHPE